MQARSSALIFLAGMCWAEAAEPKARPRLAPVAGEVKKEAVQPLLDAGSAPGFRSFGDYLQGESRRPAGLEAFRETPAAPAVAASAEQSGPVSGDAPSTRSQTDPSRGDILVLPKVEITAERTTKLEARLAELEAQQSWEESSAKVWEKRTAVDAFLNPPFLKLGSYTASGRAAAAWNRIEIVRWVRLLEISLEEAKTPADKARIQADITSLTDIIRYWE